MYTHDQLLTMARLALMSPEEARDGICGMEELEFAALAGLEDEYFNLVDWRELFLANYQQATKDDLAKIQVAEQGLVRGGLIVGQPYTKPKHVYVARKECGCVVGLVTDRHDRSTATSVAEFISDGLTVDRYDWQTYTEKIAAEETFMNCSHGQLRLPF